MKRRSFLAALVAVAAAPRLIAALSRPEQPCLMEGPFMLGMTSPQRPWFTLQEIHDRIDPNGASATLARMLNERNEILDDMPWVNA